MLPGDDEYEIISAAVDEVSSMAMYNNDSIHEMEQRLERNANMMKVVNLTRINVFDDPTRQLLLWTFNLKCSRCVVCVFIITTPILCHCVLSLFMLLCFMLLSYLHSLINVVIMVIGD